MEGKLPTVPHAPEESATRFSPVEVWESRNPWLVECMITEDCARRHHPGALAPE